LWPGSGCAPFFSAKSSSSMATHLARVPRYHLNSLTQTRRTSPPTRPNPSLRLCRARRGWRWLRASTLPAANPPCLPSNILSCARVAAERMRTWRWAFALMINTAAATCSSRSGCPDGKLPARLVVLWSSGPSGPLWAAFLDVSNEEILIPDVEMPRPYVLFAHGVAVALRDIFRHRPSMGRLLRFPLPRYLRVTAHIPNGPLINQPRRSWRNRHVLESRP